MSDTQLPKFFKDEHGYCYAAAPALANLAHLSPWNGEVDKRGFAVDTPEPKAKAKPAQKSIG